MHTSWHFLKTCVSYLLLCSGLCQNFAALNMYCLSFCGLGIHVQLSRVLLAQEFSPGCNQSVSWV